MSLNWINRVMYWCLPGGVHALLVRGRRMSLLRLNRAARAVTERNKDLCDRHRGEPCYILACGPSIKKQDLRKLAGQTCIGVSNFFVHEHMNEIQPRYYIVPPYHEPITRDSWRDWMREMERGTGDATMIGSLDEKQEIEAHQLFPDRTIHYLAFGLLSRELAAQGIDLTRRIMSPENIVTVALQAAIYMGFSPICLLGSDHTWILHLNESRHFYKESRHALSRAGYSEWFGEDFSSYCMSYVETWEQFRVLRRLAADRGIEIVNMTDGGLLDVFPRVPFGSYPQ